MSYFHFLQKFIFDRAKTKPISTPDSKNGQQSLGCHFNDLKRAQKECTKYTNCKGVTQMYSGIPNFKWFEPRFGLDLQLRKSPIPNNPKSKGENTWLKDESCKQHGRDMDKLEIAYWIRKGGKECD